MPRVPLHPHHHPTRLHRHRPVITMGVGIAIIIAIFAAVLASNKPAQKQMSSSSATPTDAMQPEVTPEPEQLPIDTADWETYSDATTGITFRHPADWAANGEVKDKDYAITITSPQEQQGNITIYVSSDSYLGFDGLPQTKTTIAGLPAIAITEGLAGLKKDSKYYTLDAGLNTRSIPTFQALLKTVQFE
jgi:hypothetical protein